MAGGNGRRAVAPIEFPPPVDPAEVEQLETLLDRLIAETA